MSCLKLADIFQSSMVLQREKPIRVWGTAETGTEVKVTLGGSETVCVAENGAFQAELPAMEAARGLTLTAAVISGTGSEEIVSTEKSAAGAEEQTAETEKIVLQDISIGDLYLAGGQSNMEYFLRYEAHFEAMRLEAENPDIHMYNVPQIAYEGQVRSLPLSGYWFTKNDPAWREFSAIGYVFAKYIQQEIGVPVGIIGCNWGGTQAVAWMSEEYANREPVNVYMQEYEKAVAGMTEEELKAASEIGWAFENSYRHQLEWRTMMYGLTLQEQEEWMREHEGDPCAPMGPYHQYRPCGLYHTMLKTVAPLSIRGVLWYQGESDHEHGEIYDQTFGAMAQCWRETFQDEELPFFTVQLAPFGEWLGNNGSLYPTVRESQERAAKNIPGVYMTSIMDLGMYEEIHPKEKCEIGRRLALLAMEHLYGLPVCGENPEITQVIRRGSQLVFHFANAGEGLVLEGCGINALSVQQGGREMTVSSVTLLKDKLVLTCDALTEEKVQIAYAWSAYCEVNLFNDEGLPVKPYRGEC